MAALALCGAASPAGAQTPTGPEMLGPDLSQVTPTNAVTCNQYPFIQVTPGSDPFASFTSCSWDADDQGGDEIAPGNGTITSVSIKVGNVTGPMQVVIMQHEAQPVDVGTSSQHDLESCCTDVAQSAVFTPAANSITTESVNLPVVLSGTSTTLDTFDEVGISVLETGVPVPAVNETSLPIDEQPATDVEEPALQDNGSPQLATDGTGYLLTMTALWNPAPAGTTPAGTTTTPSGGGTTPMTGGPTPTMSAPSTTPPSTTHPSNPTPGPAASVISFPTVAHLASVSGDHALVDLACGKAPCDGSVTIQNQAPVSTVRGATIAKAKKVALVRYAAGAFSLSAGQTKPVSTALTASGKRLAHAHRSAKVFIVVRMDGSDQPLTRQLTLRF